MIWNYRKICLFWAGSIEEPPNNLEFEGRLRSVCRTLRSIISCSSCTISSLRLSCSVDIRCSSSSLRCLTGKQKTMQGTSFLTHQVWFQPRLQRHLRSRSSASRVGFCWTLSGGGWDASSCWSRSRWISCRISLQTNANTVHEKFHFP